MMDYASPKVFKKTNVPRGIGEHPHRGFETVTFSYQGEEGDKIELIQNNFWYIKYPKIKPNLYFHYGTGLKFNKIRFTGIEHMDSFEDEIALGVEIGFAYFVTPNFSVFHRFSLGQHLPFLTSASKTSFLRQSQMHTLYLNYFFPL